MSAVFEEPPNRLRRGELTRFDKFIQELKESAVS